MLVKPQTNERKPLVNILIHDNLRNHFLFQDKFQARMKMIMALENILLEL
jgi:hypothetical protein